VDEKQIRQLMERTKPVRQIEQEAVAAFQDRIISRMVETARRETDRLEHHLLELPLSVIIYQWLIIRLKYRPWRLLVPASVALTLLLQGVLSRINIIQILIR
jgi:uncharacterized membrane protein